jgi:hypothetical protein
LHWVDLPALSQPSNTISAPLWDCILNIVLHNFWVSKPHAIPSSMTDIVIKLKPRVIVWILIDVVIPITVVQKRVSNFFTSQTSLHKPISLHCYKYYNKKYTLTDHNCGRNVKISVVWNVMPYSLVPRFNHENGGSRSGKICNLNPWLLGIFVSLRVHIHCFRSPLCTQ